MTATIEKAPMIPAKKSKTTDKVVTSLAVPQDTPFTIAKAPSKDSEDSTKDVNNNIQGNCLPIIFTINSSQSLDACSKSGSNANAEGLGTILSVHDIARDQPPTKSAAEDLQLLHQAKTLDLPIFDLREWEKLERFFEDLSTQATSQADIDPPDHQTGSQPAGEASIHHKLWGTYCVH